MAQWFHRNPMKASGRPNFDLGPVATSIPSRMLCSQLADKRQRLITMFGDFTASSDSVIDAANQYISLLMGFATSPDSGNFTEQDEEPDDDSDSEAPQAEGSDSTEFTKKDKKKVKEVPRSLTKNLATLRRLIPFTWTDSLDVKHKTPKTVRDANFELIGILYNLGLWLSKHAAKIASNNDIEMEQALDVYKSLRNAAGVFNYIKSNLLKQIKGEVVKGSDLDPNVLEAYILQHLAEAQEVTIARALELKHDPGIIAALASETAIMYEKCKFGLQSVPDALVTKWRAYCIFKAACFRAYAHCFYSESQLKADRCGVAVVSAQEALKYATQAENAAKVYRSGSGAEYVFVRRLQPYAHRTLTKALTENAMIYHQKVPATMPQLQLKPDYGVATPELPAGLSFSVDESWQEAMPGFDLTKVPEWISRKDYQARKKEAAKLHTIPEAPIYQGDKDPNNASGCVIS